VVRYGLTTWVPIYYFEAGGLSIESTILLTILLPLGYLPAPPPSLASFLTVGCTAPAAPW
jgi:sugar phosphate permease